MDPLVFLAFLAVGLIEIGLPLALGYLLLKRFQLPWKVFWFGAAFFIILQILHVPLVLFTQGPLYQWALSITQSPDVSLAVIALYLGLLAGLFEEIGRFLVLRFFFKRQKVALSKENALLFGAGWGGIECMLIGLLVLLTGFGYASLPEITPEYITDLNVQTNGTLTNAQVEQIRNQIEAFQELNPFDVLVGLLERFLALILHIAFTLLVFEAVVFNRKTLLLIAIVFHSAVDAVIVFLAKTQGIWISEAVLIGFAIISIGIIIRGWKKQFPPVTQP